MAGEGEADSAQPAPSPVSARAPVRQVKVANEPPVIPDALWKRILRAAGIVYIALIGIFAIEELQRREDALKVLERREATVAASLAILGSPSLGGAANPATEELRTQHAQELRLLAGLRARLTALILSGAIRTSTAKVDTIRAIQCELAAFTNPMLRCDRLDGSSAPVLTSRAPPPLAPPAAAVPSPPPLLAAVVERPVAEPKDAVPPPDPLGVVTEFWAQLFLKRTVERAATGDVFAVLILTAAVGGALIVGYLPSTKDPLRSAAILRALGGGVVCYLVLTAGKTPFTGADLASYKSPGAGTLLGLLAGMFSTRVFDTLSKLVDRWMDRLVARQADETKKEDAGGQ
jgi:hypothetical protein